LKDGFGSLTFNFVMDCINDALEGYPFGATHKNRKAKVDRTRGIRIEGKDIDNGEGGGRVGVFAKSDGRLTGINGLTRPRVIFFKIRFNTCIFKKGSLTKNKEVIRKQQMIDSRGASGNLHTFDISKPFPFEQ
jgi:hypothetical protein